LLAAIGRAEPALELAQSIGDPGQRQLALANIVRIHGQAGRRDAGLAAIRAMPDGQQRSATLTLASVLQDPALWEEAMSYAPTNRGFLLILARMLTARGRFDDAITRARAIDDLQLRTQSLTEILYAHYDPALAGEALRTARTIPDEGKRADAIARLARAGADPALAAEALQAVSAHPNSPDHIFALADIAAFLTAAGRLNEALDIAAGIAISPENRGQFGRNRVLTTIAVTLARQRRAADALDIARRITSPSDRSGAFVEIATALPE
jgi:tetratricopeptide (TPR) repeat protein